MEETINQFIEETWEAHPEVLNLSLELLLDKLDDLNVKADFMENPTFVSNETIQKVEVKDKKLSKEEQELTDKLDERAKVKKNLNGLKCEQRVETQKKNDETLINEVHQKLKPWKCSDCAKSKQIKTSN